MRTVALKKTGHDLIPKCRLATTFGPRFLGLMGRSGLDADEAILFPKCNSIHTFFMRFPIDVVLVSASGEVVEVVEALGAWRLLLPRRGVKHVVEMRAGRCKELGIESGNRLQVEGVFT